MVSLLTIFLWQTLVPGTAYRYWLCQLESKNTMERIQVRYKPSGYVDVSTYYNKKDGGGRAGRKAGFFCFARRVRNGYVDVSIY